MSNVTNKELLRQMKVAAGWTDGPRQEEAIEGLIKRYGATRLQQVAYSLPEGVKNTWMRRFGTLMSSTPKEEQSELAKYLVDCVLTGRNTFNDSNEALYLSMEMELATIIARERATAVREARIDEINNTGVIFGDKRDGEGKLVPPILKFYTYSREDRIAALQSEQEGAK